VGLACQAQNNTLTPAERKAGWILLFDGKTLDKWHDTRQMSPPGDSWAVEDGCIKACSKPKLGEDLFSRDTFGDFDLMFDWRVSPHGNTGVKYRVQDRLFIYGVPGLGKFERQVDYNFSHRRNERPAKGYEYVIAFEYQVIDTDKPATDKGAAGALYELIGPTRAAARPVGEFNHSRILLKGNHVEHWLNGVKVVDAELTAPEIASGLADRWGTASPVYKLLTGQPRRNCPITLQNHNDDAWFRNIKIRKL
jgi:hypothetical protein